MKRPRKIHTRLKKLRKHISRRLPWQKRRRQHRRRIIIVASSIVCIAVAVGIFVITHTAAPDSGRLVTFHDRGQDHVILTRATTIRQALAQAHITVDDKDIVEPAIDSQLLRTDSAVIIYRARPVLVVDGAFRERILTPAQSPNEIATAIGINAISDKDHAKMTAGDLVTDGASTILTIERETPAVATPTFAPTDRALTASKGAQLFVDSSGVAHRETYYDLPMNIVIRHCSDSDYSIRYDGAKIDSDGYVLVAANYAIYPKCSIVETSMGPGKVYDTGGFALRYPHGFDLATDWTNRNGR